MENQNNSDNPQTEPSIQTTSQQPEPQVPVDFTKSINNQPPINNTIGAPAPTDAKQINIKIPGWFKVVFFIGAFFTFVVIALILFAFYISLQHTKHLAKVGVTGSAVVVSEQNIQLSAGSNNGRTYIPPSYQTKVEYKLLNVPGYTSNEFSSALSSQYNKPAVTDGQKITVIYDPQNPSDNDIKSNVSQSGLATVVFIGTFVFVGISIIFALISIHHFNRRRKIINDLRSGG